MKNYNVAVLAHYPVGNEVHDGMFMRIQAIDSLFKNYNRCYIESIIDYNPELFYSLLRLIRNNRVFQKPHSEDKLKTYKFIRKSEARKIFKKVDVIYIQTWMYLRTLSEDLLKEFGHKMYLDFHGCFVEEIYYNSGNDNRYKKAIRFEKLAFQYIKNFVCVSQSMIEFYKSKFPDCDANFIKLPIFTVSERASIEKNETDSINIIYSGRNNKWQNIPEMLASIDKIKNNSKYKIKILTPDVKYFKDQLNQVNINNIPVEAKNAQELIVEYKNAHFGYILREDNVINAVSCPTTLIEYMQYGIIPVVLQPNIGDFNKLGYKYLLNSDLINGNFPSQDDIIKMREHNYNIIKSYSNEITKIKNNLSNFILND